jgi:formate hydrogenlyase transcriptional activator
MSITAAEYQALLEVSESITLHRDLPGLFHDLFKRLPRVVSFDSLSLILHNPERNTMRVHIVEMEGRAQMDVVERLVAASPSGFVWETQQPLVIADTDQENRFPEAMESSRANGIKSYCILPLTTAHRQLGSIAFGNKRHDAYGWADLEFFGLVARQVAVAVDNAISQSENQQYQQELAQERNRLRLLLNLNNSLISKLELRQLLREISNAVRGVMHCDYTSVTIPEPGRNRVRVYARNFSEVERSQEEIVLPTKNSLSAEVMQTGESLLLDHAALSRSESPTNPLFAIGLRSVCFLPLTSRKRVVGTLNVGSMQENAFDESDLDFLKQVAAQIALAIDNALSYSQVDEARQQLVEERLYLNEEIQSAHNFEEIIGESTPLRAVLEHVKTVGPTDSTVLVLGETGTGKELIARAIHYISSRKERTFVKVNCAAIPLGLLESELFGHEKGAFTGAISQKIGRFELAHEGTLFLDEIGDIPLELQPKLLRVLQEQEFERLGGTRTIRINVRLIAATSQDLPAMVANRSFRSDLYYRLNVFPITLPPLRDRDGDVALLVRYFVDKYARQMNKRIDNISSETMAALTRYHWPGNARELQNFIERAVILTRGRTLMPPLSELQQRLDKSTPRVGTLAEGERDHILKALDEADWVLGGPGGAAERLGLKRTTLFYKMRRLGISRPSTKNARS